MLDDFFVGDAEPAPIAVTSPAEPERNWRTYVFTFGKHTGRTMFFVYVNDPTYIWDFLIPKSAGGEECQIAARAALDHKNKVDPYAH